MLYLAAMPLASVLWQSVRSPQTAGTPAQLTLDNFRSAYSSAQTARLLANSLKFAFGASAVAFVVGTLLAWMNECTNTPLSNLDAKLRERMRFELKRLQREVGITTDSRSAMTARREGHRSCLFPKRAGLEARRIVARSRMLRSRRAVLRPLL